MMRGAEAEAESGGSQAWISILCNFSDSASEPRVLSYFQNMYADSYPGLGHSLHVPEAVLRMCPRSVVFAAPNATTAASAREGR
jgi:hypothetical protein